MVGTPPATPATQCLHAACILIRCRQRCVQRTHRMQQRSTIFYCSFTAQFVMYVTNVVYTDKDKLGGLSSGIFKQSLSPFFPVYSTYSYLLPRPDTTVVARRLVSKCSLHAIIMRVLGDKWTSLKRPR